jgi:hypothetical protein
MMIPIYTKLVAYVSNQMDATVMIAMVLVDAWLDIWNKVYSNSKVAMLHRSYYRKSICRMARIFSLPSMLCS